MPSWLDATFSFLLVLLPGGLWMAFWFFAVDWKSVWPVLKTGAWLPCLLLLLISAAVWSRIAPGTCNCFGLVTIGNFWWQLGGVSALAATALFTGWLQGLSGYEPIEVPLESPEQHDDAGHH